MFNAVDIGIDLGTQNILVYIRGKGIVIKEPAVISYDRDTEKIRACGEEARSMLGRTTGNITGIWPLKNGKISDYVMTEYLLKYFIHKAIGRRGFLKPRIVICVPSGVTDVERRAVREAAYQAGAKDVIIVESCIVSAIGAGLDITKPAGNMIIDIGGGATDLAVLSVCGIVSAKTLTMAGSSFTEAIIRYVRKSHLLFIGEQTAESVKRKIGSCTGEKESSVEIHGRNVFTGLPGSVWITSRELAAPLSETAEKIGESAAALLERTTPELAVDIAKRGILLTGGGALLPGVEQVIEKRLGIPVVTAENPAACAALGTAKYLTTAEYYDRAY